MRCRFSRFHPITAAVYYLSVLTVAVFVVNPIITAITFVGGLLFEIMINGVRKLAGKLPFYLLIILVISVANPIFSHSGATPLFFLNGKPITLESCLFGVNMAFATVGVFIWCSILTEIMTDDKVLYLFSRYSPTIGLVLSMTIRFIPTLKDEYKKISNAQKTMGALSYVSLADRISGVVKVFSALITWSFENSVDTANSMKGRGYGVGKRICCTIFKFQKSDAVLLSFTLLGSFLIAIMLFFGWADFYFYPKISPHLGETPWLYAVYGGLVIMPFLIEVRERLVWNVLRLKI